MLIETSSFGGNGEMFMSQAPSNHRQAPHNPNGYVGEFWSWKFRRCHAPVLPNNTHYDGRDIMIMVRNGNVINRLATPVGKLP